MKFNFLFSNKFKKIGWFLFLSGIFCAFISFFIGDDPELFEAKVFAFSSRGIGDTGSYFKVISNNLYNEITAILIIVGGILTAFSKEKNEDEYISKIRLASLVWAVLFNYGVLLLAILFFYQLSFFTVMVLNMFTTIIFFIIRFNVQLYRLNNIETDEK